MKEKGYEYYDEAYLNRMEYRAHYNQSYYIHVWNEVLKFLQQHKNPKIVELGCGTGQFAHFLWDNGFKKYLGVDFSKTGLGIARNLSKQNFMYADIRYFDDFHCNVVILLEVLEHIENDKEVLKNIPKNIDIIFSVPKFNDPAHVRFFQNANEVIDRYDMHYSEVIEMNKFILCRGYNG